MASYAIIRNKSSGRLFCIARRVTKTPGHVDLLDWVKMPMSEAGYWKPTEPQYLVGSQATTRKQVEQWLLGQTDDYELYRRIEL